VSYSYPTGGAAGKKRDCPFAPEQVDEEGEKMSMFVQGLLVGFVAGAVAGIFLGRVLPQVTSGKQRSGSKHPPKNEFEALLGGTPIATPRAPASTSKEADKLRQDLRAKFLHDEGKVNAAIELERERTPNVSEEELLKLAIYRYERENR